MMYVVHAWRGAGRSVKEWIVTQYAALIGGTEPQREAAMYSLWVDYFEVPARATFVFPRLLAQVRQREALLAASGPVRWAVKRAAYQDAARDPQLHAGLARGLAGSFYNIFGSVEAVEARALFGAIVVEDDQVRRDHRRTGRLCHMAFPFDAGIEHTVEGALDGTETLFRIEGDPGAATLALDAVVEAWPAGLAPMR